MKKFLLLITTVIMATLSTFAQADSTAVAAEEQVINVIAYFSKNDTMTYTFTDIEEKIQANDTIQDHCIVENFMVVVTDSTSEGYRLEISTIDYEVEYANDFQKQLYDQMMQLGKDTKLIVTTDEMGVVQHIENWQEIRDLNRRGIPMMFDTLYAKLPGLDSIMPRRPLESFLLLQYTTEQGIMQGSSELPLLFGLHGKALTIGENKVTSTNALGYPEEMTMVVGYLKPKTEYDYEEDYALYAQTECTVPSEDALELAKNALGMVVSDKTHDQMFGSEGTMEEARNILGDEMKVTLLESYEYFLNGWPKESSKLQTTTYGQTQKRVLKQVEWTSRVWK